MGRRRPMTARDATLILGVAALAAVRLPAIFPAPRAARDTARPHGPGLSRPDIQPAAAAHSVAPLVLQARTYRVHVDPQGFRFRIERPDARVVAPAHAISGLQIVGPNGRGGDVVATADARVQPGKLEAIVRTADSLEARVTLTSSDEHLSVAVSPSEPGLYTIVVRTGGVGPAFGLADHAAFGRTTTELTGVVQEQMRAGKGSPGDTRLVSNFVIFPRQGLGQVHAHPGMKIIRLTRDENAQGGRDLPQLVAHYFIGDPKTIYRRFLDVRNATGYKVYAPKYDWFGVGWEAWGALAWDTNQRTVTENVSRYLALGFPLRWMVIGSGFWPRDDPRFHATTSFGLWDPTLYPDPRALIDTFHQRGLRVMLGLRIAFIPSGPFAADGVQRGVFLRDDAAPRLFSIGFPRQPVHLLDAFAPGAVQWYVDLCRRWLDFGVDGFKEDLYGYGKYELRDDKIDPVNAALMDRGVHIMGRNAYLGSPVDLHRYNDFNFWETQDRGPINGLTLAYSGFPYVYPDIVGGTIAASETRDRHLPPDVLAQYLMRYARYASVHPSMSVGYGPWNVAAPRVLDVVRDSAVLHDRLHPYIYSAAIDTHRSGFPYTMTPLTLAFPDDPAVYELENTTRRGYQWLIGDALMAIPLYGDDYATAGTRDVYLPRGRWIDYDTGEAYDGPATLKQYPIPVTRTPLLVGGSGLVVERRAGSLVARLYRVTTRGETTFHHQDGRESRVRLEVTTWQDPVVVTRASGAPVPSSDDGKALTFGIEPGVDYVVRARAR
jgi:hypothetical protein